MRLPAPRRAYGADARTAWSYLIRGIGLCGALLTGLWTAQPARGDLPKAELSPRVAEVVARQKAWLESWQSLTLRVETHTVEAEGRYTSDRDVGTRGSFLWKYDRQGYVRLEQVSFDGRGRCFARQSHILTPDRKIVAHYPLHTAGLTFPESLRITRHRWPLSAPELDILPLYGLFWYGRWFPVGVEEGYLVTEKPPVERHGGVCPRIQFSNPSGAPRASEAGTITCDPRYGDLPCVWETSFPDRVEVDEYREVRPGLWIPWRGTRVLGSVARDARWKTEWVVTACDVDQPLVETEFQMPIGPKTSVTDEFNTVPEFAHPNPKAPQTIWEQWMASEGRSGGKPRWAGILATALMGLVALLAAHRLWTARSTSPSPRAAD